MWKDWLNDEARSKYGEFGYYAMDISKVNGKSLPANTRVIAYNSNVCDSINFGIIRERQDPGF